MHFQRAWLAAGLVCLAVGIHAQVPSPGDCVGKACGIVVDPPVNGLGDEIGPGKGIQEVLANLNVRIGSGGSFDPATVTLDVFAVTSEALFEGRHFSVCVPGEGGACAFDPSVVFLNAFAATNEAQFESKHFSVFTPTDGALADDDVSDDLLSDLATTSEALFEGQHFSVHTPADGALSDDDVSDDLVSDMAATTEAQFEGKHFAVHTPADGSLDDDDLSDNTSADLSDGNLVLLLAGRGVASGLPNGSTLLYGQVVLVTDDTAAGACTDAGADGQLDGGGSASSYCQWTSLSGDSWQGF